MRMRDSELVVSGRWGLSDSDLIADTRLLITPDGELVLSAGTVIVGCRIEPRGDRPWYSGDDGFVTRCVIVWREDGN